MNKWFNKQKPITLGFITAVTVFIMIILLNFFTPLFKEVVQLLKFSFTMSLLTFFMFWALFYTAEKSSIIFDEINSLFISAKKVKTTEKRLYSEWENKRK